MSKQFYSQLGDELCNMKNSPFMRIGQSRPIQSLQQSALKMRRSLSYDPDRLFDPQKFKQKQQSIIEQDYKKLMQEQKQQMFNIEYDLLKKNTHQLYQKQIQKYKFQPKSDHKQPYSWFGKCRGGCLLCQRCTQYEGCFSYTQKFGLNSPNIQLSLQQNNSYTNSQSQYKNIQIMQCYRCKCPMNSHILLNNIPSFRGQIYKYLISKNIQDNYLKINHIVLSFKLPYTSIKQSNYILQLLNNLNCIPINYTIQTKLNFQLAMIKSQIIQNGNTQKTYIYSLLNLIECIKVQKYWNWIQSKAFIHQLYQQFYGIIRKIGIQIQRQTQIGQGECVMVVLCKYDIQDVRNLIKYLSGNDRVVQVGRIGGGSGAGSVISTQASSLSSYRNANGSGSAFNNNIYTSTQQQNDIKQLHTKYQIKFIYGTNQRKQSLILSQYFFKQNYQIHYNLFLLPSGALPNTLSLSKKQSISLQSKTKLAKQQYYNSCKFKDILDYNLYIIFMQNLKQYDRVKFQQMLVKICGYKMSKINYIIGQELLNQKIKKIIIKLAVKIGLPGMNVPFQNIPDFFNIKNTNKMQIPRIMRQLYPQLTYSQRCVLIIRPFVLNSNFQEVIVNMLRINKFILLRRIKVKLSDSQVAYLATIEKIPQNMLEQYTNYMTAGVCEIILVSKRSAIYEAYALANGCLNGPVDLGSKSLKNAGYGSKNKGSISVQIKKGRDVYEEEIPLANGSGGGTAHHGGRQDPRQIFKSVRQMIDMDKVLFGYVPPAHYATNIRTKQIVRIDPSTSSSGSANPMNTTSSSSNNPINQPSSATSQQSIKITHKMKQSLLKQLRKQDFNFWLFTSLSQTLTQQLASIFIPQCTLFQPITVLIKPGLIHLVPLIKKTLLQHKYHIIVQKQIQMNRQTALEFAYNCQKIRLSNQLIKQIIQAYTKQKTYILCLSKISGRKQIMSMLSGFTFLLNSNTVNIKSSSSNTNTNINSSLNINTNANVNINTNVNVNKNKDQIDIYAQDAYISDDMLHDMLVPVWNNQQLCLKMICPPLAHMQESIKIIIDSQERQKQEQNKNNRNKNMNNTNNMNTTQQQLQQQQQQYRHISTSKSPISKYQKYTILNYLVGSFFGVGIDDLNMNSKLGKFCYYITNDPLIPRLQSWYYSQISNIKPNYIPLLFQYRQIGQTMMCIQSDRGVGFMDMIIKMYGEEMEKIKQHQQRDKNNILIDGLGLSKKNKRRSLVLFLWAKKLEQMCMDLCTLQTQLKDYGEILYKNTQYRGYFTLNQAQQKQLQLLNNLHHQFQQKDIRQNIKRLIDSRHQKQRYVNKNKRLLPVFDLINIEQCVRVIEKTQTSKLYLMDKYSFIDPENQVSKLKDLYSLHLYNVLPEIQTKYAMVADIYYFLCKFQIENAQYGHMMEQFNQIFSDLLTQNQQLQIIQYQIYLKMLLEFSHMPVEYEYRREFFNLLKSYPNLRKNKKIDRDQVAGKKRKFLDHKQYFKRANQQSQQVRQIIQKKYMNVDLNQLQQQIQPGTLYNPDDPLHYRFAHSKNIVNLLREQKHEQKRPGIYVEYEKNISQKQQILKQKIKKQVQKFSVYQQDQILHETGLEKDLWYRRAKGDREKAESKTNKAINKQIQKFMFFKKQSEKNINDKNTK